MKKQFIGFLVLIFSLGLNGESNFRSELSDALRSYNSNLFEEILFKHKNELTTNDKIKYLNMAKEQTSYIRDILNNYELRPEIIPRPKSKKYLKISIGTFALGFLLLSTKDVHASFAGLSSLGISVISFLYGLRVGRCEADEMCDLINLGYKNCKKIEEAIYDVW